MTRTAKDFDNEKWVRHALNNAGVNALVLRGVVIVKNETDALLAKAAIKANIALQWIPVVSQDATGE